MTRMASLAAFVASRLGALVALAAAASVYLTLRKLWEAPYPLEVLLGVMLVSAWVSGYATAQLEVLDAEAAAHAAAQARYADVDQLAKDARGREPVASEPVPLFDIPLPILQPEPEPAPRRPRRRLA